MPGCLRVGRAADAGDSEVVEWCRLSPAACETGGRRLGSETQIKE
jgi:hypothetical protein